MPRDEDYEEDERPRRRNRRDQDDEDERPRRRREDDADEVFDDEPAEGKRLSRSDLRAVAGYQKAIIICILIYLALIPVQFAIPEEARVFLGLFLIPLGLTATVFVFLLATKIYSPVLGVILGLLTLVPCVGLIVLLIINARATALLKSRGIYVGLLGARTSDI